MPAFDENIESSTLTAPYDFVCETAGGKAEEAQCTVATVLTLPLPAQAKWTVLQGSLQNKVAHLPWVARMALVGKAATDTADAVANAALAIGSYQVLPGSDADKRARAQLELPMRHSGMGPHRLSSADGSAAFLSSAARAHVAMIGTPEQFRPFDGPAGAGLRQEWSQLRTHVGLSDPCQEVVDVCLRTVLPQAHTDTSRATAASRLRIITTLHDVSSPVKLSLIHI